MTVYLSTSLTDAMFTKDFLIAIHTIPSYVAWTHVNSKVEPLVSLLSPSDAALVHAVKEKYDIDLPISDSIPKVELKRGDSVLLVKASFNRTLAEGERYTLPEIAQADIVFKLWNTQR